MLPREPEVRMAFGADRSVSVTLKASVSDYLGKITAASKATKDFSKSAVDAGSKHKASFDKVGTGMAITGAAIAAGVGLAIKSFADFDKQMSNVRAVSGATAGEMGKLRTAALQAGADTKYSASEAAKAESELAKVGISTSDILGGALTGSLNLAAAGNLDLAQAAEISGQAMKIFGLQGKDVGHIADVLASGANKSAADVGTLGQALQQGGLVAAQTGLTLEDTVGTLSAFADNALNGSDAGTSLKTMLQRLNPQSDEAADLMDTLGLSAYDAQGQFVGITAYAGKLQTALRDMSAEQRNSTMSVIFGSDAVRAANILYKEGAAGIQSYITGVNDQGAAARVAAIQMDNLSGDVEQLKGSIETGLIQAGAGANDMLRDLTQLATGAVNIFTNLPAPLQQGALGLAAVSAAGLLAGGAIIKIVPQISATRTAMADLGVTAPRVAAGLRAVTATLGGPWGIALVAAAAVVGSFISKQIEAKAQADELRGSLDQQTGAITGNTRAIVARNLQASGAFDIARGLGISLQTVTDAALGNTDALDQLTSGQKAYNAASVVAINNQIAAGDGLSGLAGQTDVFASSTEKASAQTQGQAANFKTLLGIVTPINGVLSGQSEKQREIAEATGQTAGKLGEYGSAAGGATSAADAFAQAQQDSASATQEANKQLDDYIQKLQDAGMIVLSTRAAQRAVKDAYNDVTDALKKNGKTMDQNKQAGRDNAAVLDDIAQRHLHLADSVYKQTGSEGKMRASLVASRKALSDTGVRFGLTRKAADAYAADILKIPTGHATKITTPGATKSKDEVDKLRGQIAILKGKAVKVAQSGAVGSAAEVKRLRDEIALLHSKEVDIVTRRSNITINETRSVNKRNAGSGSDPTLRATGGAISGPGTGTSDDIPAWLSNGEHVLTAEDVRRAGGHEAIYAWRKSLGSSVKRFARGGAVGFASGGEVDFQGIMAIIQAGAFSYDDLKSAQAKPGQVRADLKKAQDALKNLLARQEKNKRDLAAARANLDRLLHTRGASKTSITSARNRVSDELAEQHKLLGQVATAEGKVTTTRNTLTAATNAASDAAAKYAKANRPLITRTIEAAGARNSVTAKFLANIRILMARGFTSLARNLMNMGGPEAETLAAQAVKSTKDAKSLQSRLDTSAKLDADAQALQDKLDGKSAPVWKGATTTYASGKKHVPNAVKGRSGGGALTKGGVTVSIGNMNAVDADAAAQAIITAQRDAIAAFG